MDGVITGVWFNDAVHGRRPEFPQSAYHLQCLQYLRSRSVLLIISGLMVLLMIGPFTEEPVCARSLEISKAAFVNYRGNWYTTRFFLSIFDIGMMMVFFADLAVAYVVDPWPWFPTYVRGDAGVAQRRWTLCRFLCCCSVVLDCLIFLGTRSRSRVSRCLFPLIFISRRENLKRMLEGVLFSAYSSLFIQMALVFSIITWGCTGYMTFRTLPIDGGRFSTLPESILTTLHCYSSRPSVLYALNPFFNHGFVSSATFFVTLTMVADIVCTTLIIAIARRFYRNFGTSQFVARLSCRRDALRAVFYLHTTADGSAADSDRTMSFTSWLRFCELVTGKYVIDPNMARLLYSTEAPFEENLTLPKFARLCAVIAARVRISISSDNLTEVPHGSFTFRSDVVISLVRTLPSIGFGESPLTAVSAESSNCRKSADSVSSRSSTISAAPTSFAALINIRILAHCRFMLSDFTIKFFGYTYHGLECLSLCSLVLLIIQLAYLSRSNCSSGWIVLGWLLEIFFWYEMLVHIVVLGWNRMPAMISILINAATFCSMCALGTSNFNETVLEFVLASQFLRFFRLLSMFEENSSFSHMVPIIMRAE